MAEIRKKDLSGKSLAGTLVFLAVAFATAGVHEIHEFQRGVENAAKTRRLAPEVRRAENIESHDEAAAFYRNLNIDLPEADLQIVRRQWEAALGILHQIQLARFNRILKDEEPAIFVRLNGRLDDMADMCGEILAEAGKFSPEILWRAFNFRGAVRLISAYAIIETENNPKKAAGHIREAIFDFRNAIENADKLSPDPVKRSIPRWNLELLHAEEFVKKISLSRVDSLRRLDLRENLEALIPEKGGYAPGDPVEIKVEK